MQECLPHPVLWVGSGLRSGRVSAGRVSSSAGVSSGGPSSHSSASSSEPSSGRSNSGGASFIMSPQLSLGPLPLKATSNWALHSAANPTLYSTCPWNPSSSESPTGYMADTSDLVLRTEVWALKGPGSVSLLRPTLYLCPWESHLISQ